MGNFKFNIGIIGGGIGGVAAAVALHRAGIDATVYERANELREVGAGMMLWPNATRVLKELGLLERVVALSGPNHRFLVRSSTGSILMNIGLGHFDVPALCTRRSDLLDALISALPADRVRLGYEFGHLERQSSSVGIHFSNGVSVEHDFLIGADGIRSRVRSQLLGVHETIYRGYTVWRGLARLRGSVPDGSNSETWGRGKRFGILHTGADRVVLPFGMLQRIPILLDHVDSTEAAPARASADVREVGHRAKSEKLLIVRDRQVARRHPEKWRVRPSAPETLGTRESDFTRGRCSSLHAEPRTGRLHGA